MAALLGGCVAWPETATGGLAEMYPSTSPRLKRLELRFVGLANGPAANMAPAMLIEARGYLIRAKREHAGGLLVDAEASADQVETILTLLEARWPPAPGMTR
jgi:hypothetical protein